MKRKYYPAITFLGAVAFTFIPLLVLLVGLNIRNRATSVNHNDFVTGTQNELLNAPVRVAEATLEDTAYGNVSDAPVLHTNQIGAPASNLPTASRADQKANVNELPVLLPEPQVSTPVIVSTPDPAAANRQQMAGGVPAPLDATTEGNPAFLVQTGKTPEEIAKQEAENANLEMPRRPDVDQSYYAATGHLAMASVPLAVDPLTVESMTSSPPRVSPANDEMKQPSDLKTRKDRTRKQKDEPTTQRDVANAADGGVPSMKSPSDVVGSINPTAMFEDVSLQTPRDGSTVSRVEDVVALTRAKGWPIALIKSDLPDDVWWVQQIVGFQGNAFAARVNFGNEHSIRGTMYHMVFVFLDSPDEVRRFRIAKQFKEVPDGVRRSKEFHFIRN